MKLKLTVDFFGVPRLLSGEKGVVIEVDDDATLRDVNAELVRRFPSFLGRLILPETYDLVEAYYFYNFYTGRAVRRGEKLKGGERLLLMFVDAGG